MMDSLDRQPDGARAEPTDHPLRDLHRTEEGTALTEFIIIAPTFIIVLTGLMALGDLVIQVNRAEVLSYREAMSTTMEQSQRDAFEAADQGDYYQISPDHMTTHAGGGALHEYPARGTAEDTRYDSFFEMIYNPNFAARNIDSTHYSMGQALHANNLMPADDTGMETLMNTPGATDQVVGGSQPRMNLDDDFYEFFSDYAVGGLPAKQDLWGRRALQDRTHFEHDQAQLDELKYPASREFFEIEDTGLGNIASDLAVAIGSRYGTVGDHHEIEVSHEFGNFEYDTEFGNYYTSAIPPYVAETEDGDRSAREAARRAIAVRRLTMDIGGDRNQQVVYDRLLGIDEPDMKIGDASEMKFLTGTEPDPDDAPPVAEDVYDGHLSP